MNTPHSPLLDLAHKVGQGQLGILVLRWQVLQPDISIHPLTNETLPDSPFQHLVQRRRARRGLGGLDRLGLGRDLEQIQHLSGVHRPQPRILLRDDRAGNVELEALQTGISAHPVSH